MKTTTAHQKMVQFEGDLCSVAYLKAEMKRLFAEQKTADQNRKDEITDKLSEIEALIS